MRSLVSNILFLAVSCWAGFAAHGADTNHPVVVSAGSYDGQIVGVCFSEPLDQVSATNIANYRISDVPYTFPIPVTDYAVAQAVLRPDQRSVVLTLSNPFPGAVFSLSVTNVRDLSSNSGLTGSFTGANHLSATDIGIPGVDPQEPGTLFNCWWGSFEVAAGGSGLDGTNDSFNFIYEPWRGPALILLGQVTSLEAANRFSSAGLMVRENLSPGSRFFSVMVTPPDVPARDGSGNGANTVMIRYRDAPDGPSTELASTNSIGGMPYPDVWLQVFRGDQRCVALISTNYPDWITVGEFTFTSPLPNPVLAGLATFSHNNAAGFATKATYANTGLLKGDVFIGPLLSAERSATNLVLRWEEPLPFPYFLVSASALGPGVLWNPVPNQVTYQITPTNAQATVTVPVENTGTFYGLRSR